MTNEQTGLQKGAHWAAVTTALLTLPLLFSGGSVTSYGVGMAVPDWPTTFGENMVAYDMTDASFGVQVEHSHRLIGMAVGIAGMATFVLVWLARPSKTAVVVAGVAFLAICLQGLLGGLRVRLNAMGYGTQLAVVHACFGQLTFGLLCATAVLTGRRWRQATPLDWNATISIRASCAVSLVLLTVQVVTGALLRHLGFGFWLHATLAAGLFFVTLQLVFVVLLDSELKLRFKSPVIVLAALMTAQLFLGVAAALTTGLVPPQWRTWSPDHLQALVRTGHQFNGALVLMTLVALSLMVFRKTRVDAPILTRREKQGAGAPRSPLGADSSLALKFVEVAA